MIVLKEKINTVYNQLFFLISSFKNDLSLVTTFNSIPRQIQNASIGDNKLFSLIDKTILQVTENDLCGVTTIGDWAFYGCNSLTSATIPDSVTTIGYNAFNYCLHLESVIIGNGVSTIGSGAFTNCQSLTSITIPSSVRTIGSSTFSSCIELTSITIKEGVATIGEEAFSRCISLESVTIPDSVRSIGNNAFSNCTNIKIVEIGKNLNKIPAGMFKGCESITDIYLYQVVPPTLTIFETFSSFPTIHVPIGSGDAYKSSTNWSYYSDRIVEDIVIE